ncbi:hypothetical protein SDC9_178853 [bioreactor metagenome]|uniref:Uncharacterized protein n=1 Tax=bioreactor metagenome TaxID=1076179 RepID=A0A645H069_9ZZZZ
MVDPNMPKPNKKPTRFETVKILLLNNAKLKMGSAAFFSKSINKIQEMSEIPIKPRICQENHAYSVPPRFKPSSSPTVPVISVMAPA